TFHEILSELKIIDKRAKTWRALLYYLDNAERLKDCAAKLHWAMEEFQVSSKVDSCLKDLQRHEELRMGQERILESQQEMHQGLQRELQKGRNEVRYGFLEMREAMKEQDTSHALSSILSSVLPPDPKIFGRREYIQKAVKLLLSATGGRIVILGPGGMGKTSVALKVIHDSLVVERFGDNRCWIPCEQATSVPLFIELIARSLNLPNSSSKDRLAEIIAFLKSSKILYVLLLDNFETPWDIEGHQSHVADVLTSLASIPTVSLIITMRGNQHPSSHTIEWTEPRLPSLLQLDLDSAEEAFLKISPAAKGDPGLRTLLQKLDCMPLAITLMAKLSEDGETISELLEQWKSERTRLLDQPGGDRRNSIEVSIRLSLHSRSVKGNPDAIRLLSVLAMLPAGAALDRVPQMCPSIPGWRAALRVLRAAALVYGSVDKSRIQMLSPIQSYILLHHPLEQQSLKELRALYYELAPEDKSRVAHPDFKNVRQELVKEEANLEAILINALHDQNGDRETAISASVSYTLYLIHQRPRSEVIAEAVLVAKATDSSMLARCLYWYATILYRQGRSQEAESVFKEARDEYTKTGNQESAAQCSGHLGALLLDRGQLEKARALMQESRDTLLQLGSVNKAAWCLWDFGRTYSKQGDYKSACSIFEQARLEFDSTGDHIGSLRCLTTLGSALGHQGDYDAAESALEEATSGFIELGDLYSAAHCLCDLGIVFKQAGNYPLSLEKFQEGLAIYTQIGNLPAAEKCKAEIDELQALLTTG
ncbi:hypothetical protein FRC02_000753, partial [Tulasnella sp. 418]